MPRPFSHCKIKIPSLRLDHVNLVACRLEKSARLRSECMYFAQLGPPAPRSKEHNPIRTHEHHVIR
eukprot:389577-Rhodomonas_salina.1